ncbi:MAG: Gfo/Idh/MocA family oxidoreductase [Rhodospirillales bacterium]|nr:Gfo/Idh/MocA family oxidoreductase [Rhodospirillales bacterium]
MKRYALVGAAGYVAPRHMKAIKETGGDLVAALDTSDSVGVIDSHFPDARFFTEFERFDRHIDKMYRAGNGVNYVSICSPNYLHDAHCRFALRSGADAICEKPLVLNPWNLDGLQEMEQHTGRKVYSILQLRLHPAIIALKEKIAQSPADHIFDVDLTYITSRGGWYHVSWKGDESRSGGIATNIGVHFYDMLSFVFGDLQSSVVHQRTSRHSAGYLEFKRARVRWFLSVDRTNLPAHTPEGQTTYRSITVDGDEVEFSGGFTDLHTLSYQDVLGGGGFGLEVVRPAIELVANIRTVDLKPQSGEQHPFAKSNG